MHKAGTTNYSRTGSYFKNNTYNKVVTVDGKSIGDKKIETPYANSVASGIVSSFRGEITGTSLVPR